MLIPYELRLARIKYLDKLIKTLISYDYAPYDILRKEIISTYNAEVFSRLQTEAFNKIGD